ncbi:hypothetical protein BJ508DRAFT_127140 [Ascobolus immersus RN42]|uniref:Uncharacterized protein n=1 Tax=Ascobolus immersus RN42 TaxID=1160509 RepID=A0A3N4I8Y9_ASCIM|nr:hypothetical protein BJ508DRAFT_127140 [Ascobolus immersus RN42]
MVAAFAIEAIVVTFFALAAVLAAVQTALHAWKHRKSPSPSRAASPEQLEKGQVDLKKEEAIAATVDSMSTKRLNGHRRRSSNAFEKIPKDSKGKRPWGNRFRSAFRGTISGFWEGAVMFSISLSIAAAVVFFSKSGSYSLFFSALITVFASSCCYALWPLVDGITGRRTLYNIMLLFITIQQFMLFGAFRRYVDMDNYHETIATPEEDHIRGELWEQYCFYKIKPTVFIERIVSVTLGFGCIVLLKMFFVDFLRPVLRKRNNVLGDKDRKPHTFMLWDWTEKYKWWLDLSWKVFVGGCGFSMMWGSYGRMIIGKKRLLALHAGAGNLEGENSWEFGQITAVLTWVPYSGEFIFILCLGYRRAITSRIPKDLRAIFVTPASDPSKDVGSGSADEEPSPLNKRSTTMILNPFSIGLDRLGGRRKSKKQETAEVPSQSTYDPDGIEETAATTTTVEYEDLKGGKGTGGHYEHRSL